MVSTLQLEHVQKESTMLQTEEDQSDKVANKTFYNLTILHVHIYVIHVYSYSRAVQ